MKRNGKREEERKSWTIWIMFQNVTDVQSKRRPKGPKVGNWPQKKNNFLLQNQQKQVVVVEKRLPCALGISSLSVPKYGTKNWPNLSAIPAATRWRRTEKTLLCIGHKKWPKCSQLFLFLCISQETVPQQFWQLWPPLSVCREQQYKNFCQKLRPLNSALENYKHCMFLLQYIYSM